MGELIGRVRGCVEIWVLEKTARPSPLKMCVVRSVSEVRIGLGQC